MSSANNQKDIKSIVGDTLVTNDGQTIDVNDLIQKRKTFLLYFSAHWCPPCRAFTPKLAKAFEDYKNKCDEDHPQDMEIIFISSDQDQDSFQEYHKLMTFPALPYDNRDLKAAISKQFDVQGIPTMVLLDHQGQTIDLGNDTSPRSLVEQHGADAFPLSKEHVEKLNQTAKEQQLVALKQLSQLTVPLSDPTSAASQEEKKEDQLCTFKQLIEQNDYIGLVLGDGDFEDPGYNKVIEVANDINATITPKKSKTFLPLYIGWSLYNSQSDHKLFANKFHSISEPSEQLRALLTDIAAQSLGAPTMIILRNGAGLCSMDGTCEESGVPVIVTMDPGLQKLKTFGSSVFPWDKESVETAIKAEKERVEKYRSLIPNLQFLNGLDMNDQQNKPALLKNKAEDTAAQVTTVKDLLESLDDDAIVALYFSAHWCPPCRALTPQLLKCYEEINSKKENAQKKSFEVIFFSFDSDQKAFEQYYTSMCTSSKKQWMAIDYSARTFCKDISNVFDVQGYPTLILLKKDGTIISKDAASSLQRYGPACFPWTDEAVEKHQMMQLDLEKQKMEEQEKLATHVVKRLVGEPGSTPYDPPTRCIEFKSTFPTAVIEGCDLSKGVFYYELHILELNLWAQYGFAVEGNIAKSNERKYAGVGDTDKSWAVDGVRQLTWGKGDSKQWTCSWSVGDTVGLAVNVAQGKIAVSKNGSWSQEEGCGVVFEDPLIAEEKPLVPCFTGSDMKLCVNVLAEHWKFGPPQDDVWSVRNCK